MHLDVSMRTAFCFRHDTEAVWLGSCETMRVLK
jgi:hypothetical protein